MTGFGGALAGLGEGAVAGLAALRQQAEQRLRMAQVFQQIQLEQQNLATRQAQQQSLGLLFQGFGSGGPDGMFQPMPAPPSSPGSPAGAPGAGNAPQASTSAPPPSPAPAALPVASGGVPPGMRAGTAPIPTPAVGAPSYTPPPNVGGMAADGNWELQHNNFAGLRQPGVQAGPHAGGFQSFATPQQGIEAISHQLDRYAAGATTGKPLTTLRQIVSTWMPASDGNPTPLLIQRAAAATGFGPDQPLDLSNPTVKAKVIHALILDEQGGRSPYTAADIYATLKQAPARINAHLHTALGGAPTAHAAQPIANRVVNTTPPPAPQMDPMALMRAVAERINQAAPDAPDNVKALAWMQAMNVITRFASPYMKMQWDMAKFQISTQLREQQLAATERLQQAELGLRGQQLAATNRLRQTDLDLRREQMQDTAQYQHDNMALRAEIAGITPGTAQNQSIAETARGIAAYRLAPLSAFALRSPWGQQVMARVMQINPNYNAAQFGARQAATRSFAGGPLGNTVRSMSVGISHLDVATQLVEALQNGDNQLLNRMGNALKTEFGQAAVPDFNTAKQIVGDEVAKAIQGGNVAVTDRTALQQQFSDASSPKQLLGVINVLKRMMAGQLDGLRRQYINSTGGSAADFDKMLSPEARAQLEGEGGGGAPAGKGAAGGYPTPSAKAIAALKDQPSLKTQFDQVFGPGAAERVLGQK
jgi:hypothetical protein